MAWFNRKLSENVVRRRQMVAAWFGIDTGPAYKPHVDEDPSIAALFAMLGALKGLLEGLTEVQQQQAAKLGAIEARVGKRASDLAEEFGEGPAIYDMATEALSKLDALDKTIGKRLDILDDKLGVTAGSLVDAWSGLGSNDRRVDAVGERIDNLAAAMVDQGIAAAKAQDDVKLAHERIGMLHEVVQKVGQKASPVALADDADVIIDALNRIERKLINFGKRGAGK